MINFLYGNPGTGKTEIIFAKLKQDADNGRKALLIVPEQMTVAMEREMLMRLPPSAQLHIEVLNFTRLANKLFRLYGGLSYSYATPAIQKLVMWQALKTSMPFLSEYQVTTKDDKALADAMLAVYKEFSANGVAFELLDKLSNEAPQSALSAKLRDISTVCTIYSQLISERFSDENDELYRLSKLISETNCLKNINIYIDGFSSLTGLEHNIIKSIFRQADNCWVTIGIPNPGFKGIDTVSLKRFSDILRRDCASLGISCKAHELSENMRTNSAILKDISANLWQLDAENLVDEKFKNNNSLELIRATDIYDECEYASAKINNLIQSGYRYRDISIIVRNADKYRGIIEPALENNDIPFFISDKTDLSLSPLSRLILSALRIANFGWQRADIITHLKTGLCGVSTKDVDIFEYYTAKWKISGKQFTSDFDWNMNPEGYTTNKTERGEKILATSNSVKNTFIAKLRKYITQLKNAATYKELCIETLNYLDSLNVKSHLKEISIRYLHSGKIREASEFVRIYDIFIDALDSICEAFPEDAKPDLTTFSTALKTILENTELGSIPTSQDEVTIGSANMIRADNAKCVILLGACDGEFPANIQSTGLLTDTERDYLINHDIKISGDRELRASDELYYFRRAAASASQKLIVFTRADSEPSIGFSRLVALLPGVTIQETANDLLAKLSSYHALAEYYPLFKGTAHGEAIKMHLQNSPDKIAYYEGGGLSAINDRIDPQIIEHITGKHLRLSQSKIEQYTRCKFSYSCKYFLNLDDGKQAEFAYNNIGTFVHAILEKFLYHVFVTEQGNYPNNNAKNSIIDKIIDQYLSDLLPDQNNRINARLIHLIARLKKVSVLIIDDILEELSDSSFIPHYFELPIGTKEQPSIKINLKNGTTLSLNGIIDRVDIFKDGDDIYLRVVDYKTGNKTFSISDIESGKNLQLLLYIFALTQNKHAADALNGNLKPAAISYISAVPSKVHSLGFYDTANTQKSAISEITRSGLIIDNEKILNAVSHSSQNRYLMASLKKRSTVTDAEFTSLFNRVNDILASIGEEIVSGNANAIPDERSKACNYCSFASVCRAAKIKK